MTNFNIRAADAQDILKLVSLIRAANIPIAARLGLSMDNAPKHPSNCEPDWITESMAKGVRYFLLEIATETLGCIAIEQANAEVCYLERLAVRPEQQGRGFGRALLTHALEAAGQLGAKRVGVGIIASHIELHDWYAHAGFATTGRKRFPHLPFEVEFMSLELAAV